MARHRTRRSFLGASFSGAIAAATDFPARASGARAGCTTYTYKTAGECAIKADVYNASPGDKRPLAVWIHGGALIMGNRNGLDRALLAELTGAGYVVVSMDYRLAPETKLPSILDDVRAAFAWVQTEGPKRFGARTDRIAVLGGSAGGYLTLATGYLIEPRPAALASYWGYGDISGAWYSKPDPFYRRQPLVSEAEARAAVGTDPISEPAAANRRGRFYIYCRQNGLWTKEVTGLDPVTDAKSLDRFCPVRNVSAQYPPTLLVHGTSDTDVPHNQSVFMDKELARHNVPHEFISIPGGGHGLAGIERSRVAAIHKRALAFLRRHVQSV
jgi:acetyl esterase/lipase